MRDDVEILLVTCCLEQSRWDVLQPVVNAMQEHLIPYVNQDNVTVFDNASTVLDTIPFLKNVFSHIYYVDKNIGYWSAIYWWLKTLEKSPRQPKYVYIIESDLVHFEAAHQRLLSCLEFLDKHENYGSIRLYEWTFAERHLYDKDHPVEGSKRNAWRSHINSVTKKRVEIFETPSPLIYGTTFLTQLVAINRYTHILSAFEQLATRKQFSEPDFQRLYYESCMSSMNKQPLTGIVEGGLFHCNLATYGTRTVTSSYTTANNLSQLGYFATRISNIIPRDQYVVTKL